MRKLLLTLGAALITVSGFSQNQARPLVPTQQRLFFNDPTPASNIPVKNNTSTVFKKSSVNHGNTRGNASLGAKIGSSANIFTALVPEQHLVGYKKIGSKDVFYMIHRQCSSFVNASDSAATGYMEMDASLDHGKTWDSSMHRIFVKTHNGSKRPRYPSGDLFVPNSDTNWLHSLAVGSGPVTGTSSSIAWIANWFGSCSMDTANKHFTIVNTNTSTIRATGYVFPRLSTTATKNYVWALSIHESPNNTANPKINALGLYKGTYSSAGDSFSWSVTKLPLPTLSYAFINGTAHDTGYYFASANMAWGNDGKTGYIVACNVDSAGPGNDHYKYHIWKTTDEGSTWTTSVLDPSDSAYCHLKDSLRSIRGSAKKYFIPFNDEDLVVDANGNLHIVAGFTGAYSANKDSLANTYMYETNGTTLIEPWLVDLFQKNGKWSYFMITHIQTSEVLTNTTGNSYIDGSGSNMAWGSRVQASCEYSTNKIFYSWMDSDPTANTANLAPDVYVSALDLTNSKYKPVENMTIDGAFAGQIYWYYAAKNILKTTSGSKNSYTIPATASLPFDYPTTNGAHPHCHYFLSGLNIPEDSFYSFTSTIKVIDPCVTATSDINTGKGVASIYPNPAHTNCVVEFTAQHGTSVSIEITNLLGQTLQAQNVKSIEGLNRVNVDMTNLTPGVYLVVVKNGDTRNTYKLIKE